MGGDRENKRGEKKKRGRGKGLNHINRILLLLRKGLPWSEQMMEDMIPLTSDALISPSLSQNKLHTLLRLIF